LHLPPVLSFTLDNDKLFHAFILSQIVKKVRKHGDFGLLVEVEKLELYVVVFKFFMLYAVDLNMLWEDGCQILKNMG